MRHVGLSDLDIAARALLYQPESDWEDAARAMIDQAHVADLWRKRHGMAHPDGGTGSLYAQASLLPRATTTCNSTQYCAALAAVLQALVLWRLRSH